MAVLKCKMCGGDLVLEQGTTVATCEYCGTTQTVPSADNDKKLTLFSRANRLRFGCEFDKAAGVYEAIVADFPEEAEAYWGLVLCQFGIEYVDDPATGRKVPTCHRSSFESVMQDENFQQALENADVVARKVYREEAKAIEELRKDIVEVSSKEEPYDIFICYKETAEDGQRTLDSVLAQDVYDALTEKGYRVFFSRITLEDKLGREYEPYIFAALHSAKVMLAFGTDYEYFNAVWVKNEWSRYLSLIAAGEKKTLIPCYKGIDAYDLPQEFAKLQAQDLGKIGAVQDLLRGIDKLIAPTAPVVQATPQIDSQDLSRSFIYNTALEQGKSKKIKTVKEAIEKMQTVAGWGDADEKLNELKAHLKKLKRKRLVKRLIVWAIILGIVGGTTGVIYSQYRAEQIRKEQERLAREQAQRERAEYCYNAGEEALNEGLFIAAISAFEDASSNDTANNFPDISDNLNMAYSYSEGYQVVVDVLFAGGSEILYADGYMPLTCREDLLYLYEKANTVYMDEMFGNAPSDAAAAETVAPMEEEPMPTEPDGNGETEPMIYVDWLRWDVRTGNLIGTIEGSEYIFRIEEDGLYLEGNGYLNGVRYTHEYWATTYNTYMEIMVAYGLGGM